MNSSNHIADFYYNKRLSQIENGLPVHRISIFLGYNGDFFEFIGNNTGIIEVESINEIIERFGKPIDIEIEHRNWPNEFNFLENFVDENAKDLSFRELKSIKNGEFFE